jgi:hypothetical protein
MELGLREGVGEHEQRHPCPTADVGDLRAGLESLGQAGHPSDDRRHEEAPHPGRESTFDATRPLRAEGVVGQPETGAKRLTKLLDGTQRLGELREHARPECRMRFFGEHDSRLRGQCEALLGSSL